MTTTNQPTEIARAAVTLLSQANVCLPELVDWIRDVVASPTYTEFPPDVLTKLLNHDTSIYPEEWTASGWLTSGHVWGDRAAFVLAWAVVRYRQTGHPVGDVYESMGSGLGVPTSLAAAVAEYVQGVLGAAAIDREDAERARS